MDIKELDRQKNALEVECRTLRNKKIDLESGIKDLVVAEHSQREKTSDARKDMALLSETRKQLQGEYSKEKALLDGVIRANQKEHKELGAKLAQIEKATHALNLKQEGIDTWREKLKEQETDLKLKTLRNLWLLLKKESKNYNPLSPGISIHLTLWIL